MANLALQADLEKFLKIDVTAEPDAAITASLEAASAIIESYCNRVFTEDSIADEVHDGGFSTVFLRRPPVTVVNTVVENSIILTAADYLFYPEDGRLIRRSGAYPYVWYWKPRTVVVTYDGGFNPIPFDVRDVCVRIAARVFQASDAFAASPASGGAYQSVTLAGSDSVTFADAVSSAGGVASAAVQLTDADKAVLNKYRLLNVA